MKIKFIIKVCLLMGILAGAFLFTGGVVLANGPYPDGQFPEGEEISDDLFLEGAQIEIAGTVHGMVFAFGQDIVVTSTAQIEDDVFLFGQQITIEAGAQIDGNVYASAQNVIVRSEIGRSLFAGSATLELQEAAVVQRNLFFGGFHFLLSDDSVVQRNLYAGGYQMLLDGTILQNVRISSAAVELDGEIGGDAEVRVDSQAESDELQIVMPYLRRYNIPDPVSPGLRISDQANISGQLVYTSASRFDEAIKIAPDGGIVFNTPQPGEEEPQQSDQIDVVATSPVLRRTLNTLRSLLVLAGLAALGYWLVPKWLRESAGKAADKPLRAAGLGLISTIVVYIGAFVVFGLIIFLTAILGALTFGGLSRAVFSFSTLSLGWVVATFTLLLVYASKLVVAYWIGDLVLYQFNWQMKRKELFALLLGVLIFVLVAAIPFIGWLISLAVTLVGLGAILFTIQNRREDIQLKPAE